MKIYNDVVRQLDSGGAHYSQDLSEIDLTDPDDVKVLANHRAGEVLVHLGSSNYLERYKVYVTHVQEWQQQFDKLESVDLRYDRQIIVNPDLQGAAKQPPISSEAAKKAMAAGVKPAALITRMTSWSEAVSGSDGKNGSAPGAEADPRKANRDQARRKKISCGKTSGDQSNLEPKGRQCGTSKRASPANENEGQAESQDHSISDAKEWAEAFCTRSGGDRESLTLQSPAQQLPGERKHNRNGEPARASSDGD